MLFGDKTWRSKRYPAIFAEQLLQYGFDINEVLAFMLALGEKADMEGKMGRGLQGYWGNTRLFTIRRP